MPLQNDLIDYSSGLRNPALIRPNPFPFWRRSWRLSFERQVMNTFSLSFGRAMPAVLLTVALASLAACGKKNEEQANSSVAATPASPAAGVRSAKESPAAQSAEAKMNGYTQAYNKLIGTFGLTETHQRYLKENIAKKKASDSISITDGWVEIALNQFKKARALPGAAPGELDASADALIAALDKLVIQLKALDVYYESKAYREDNLAKGKAEDATMRASFDASVAATEKFNTVLGREERKANAVILAQLKSSGDMLGYNTKLALQQAQEIVDLFNSEPDIKNPEIYKKADAVVSELEKTLAEQRQQYAAAKTKNANPDSGHESAASSLTSLIGEYRDMKQSKQAKDYDDVVKYYNRAIESANGIN
jgi:ATP-dependent exoDNAse (exonuclease V) beta subunit